MVWIPFSIEAKQHQNILGLGDFQGSRTQNMKRHGCLDTD